MQTRTDRPKGSIPPWRRNLPDAYKEEERLDGVADIARFLGIHWRTFREKHFDDMKESGIIFVRSDRRGPVRVKTKYFTYKRLVLAWLIKKQGEI